MSALVEAARFSSQIEADLFRLFLGSHGVESVLFDAASSLYSDGALINVRLMVLDDDLGEARRLWEEYQP